MLIAALFAALVQVPGETESARIAYLRVYERVELDGSVRRVADFRATVRTPAGVAEFGQAVLPYVAGYGEASFEDVRVEKPDGQTRDVRDLRVEDLNPFGVSDGTVPSDVRVRRITIPGLEPGDSISYRMVSTLRPFTPGHSYGDFKFAAVRMDQPQTYELDLPAGSRILARIRPGLRVDWVDVPGPSGRVVRRLTYQAAPPVIGSRGPTFAQVAAFVQPDVSYSTFREWSDVTRWWWDMSRDRLAPDPVLRRESARLIAGKTDPRSRLDVLAAFAAGQIRYLNVSFGIGRMQPRPAASVLANRFGDCKDKVALLVALASASGIEVRPALISSVRTELDDAVPGPQQFDHMIAVAILGPDPADWLWVDPTNGAAPPTWLQPALREKRAVVIDRSGSAAVFMTPSRPPYPTRKSVELTAAFDAAVRKLKGAFRITDRSDTEVAIRYQFGAATAEHYPEIVKRLISPQYMSASISNVRIGDPARTDVPFQVDFDFEQDVRGQKTDGEWRFLVADLGETLVGVPDDGTAPWALRFFSDEIVFRAKIEVPEGIAVRPPLSISLDRPFASVRSKYSFEGRTLVVERTISFNRPTLTHADVPAYEALRKQAATDREQEFILGPVRNASTDAASLQERGNAAYDDGKYQEAADLLREAASADPKLKDVHQDLGLAYRKLKREQDAVTAFSRQIEVSPFHEGAYAERAYSLFALQKPGDAEKDLLKQIEVAPFKDWSYARLAQRRMEQGRHSEAAELYDRALTIDGSSFSRWMALARARIETGERDLAVRALEGAGKTTLAAGYRTEIAQSYRELGDLKAAARWAEMDLEPLAQRLGRIDPAALKESDLVLSQRLAEAWTIIGEEAARSGDVPRAERFLKAAWETGLRPAAAFALGRLRLTQGREAAAARLWAAASGAGPWKGMPSDFEAQLAELRRKAPGAPNAVEVVGTVRFQKLIATTTATLTADVLVLQDGGRVTAIKGLSDEAEAKVNTVRRRIVGVAAPTTFPDAPSGRVIRRGLLACHPASGCQIAYDLENTAARSTPAGQLELIRISPARNEALKAGASVRVEAMVRAMLSEGATGTLGLMVTTGGREPLTTVPIRDLTAGTTEHTLTAEFTVPADATRVTIFIGLSANRLPGGVETVTYRVTR